MSRFSIATPSTASASRRSLDAGGFPGKKTTVVLGVPVAEVTVVVFVLPSRERLYVPRVFLPRGLTQ